MPITPVGQRTELQTKEINEAIVRLAQIYEGPYGTEIYQGAEPRINLNYLASKMALFYEKLRYSVDYKEEHLLRRSAIERIIKRIILLNRKNPHTIAETLLHELIRAQYLPNDTIPEDKTHDIAIIINKYLKLYDQLELRYQKERAKTYLKTIWEMMAAEIEESLIPPIREDALVETLYKIIKPKIDLRNFPASEKERNIQLYLAIHRNIIKSDNTLLTYYLFKFYFPGWRTADEELINKVAESFPYLIKAINYQLKHPLADIFLRKLHNYCSYFIILNDVLAENRHQLKKVLSTPKLLEEEINKACEKRYAQARKKLRRGAVRAVIYIFVTKVLIATAIELPYDMLILNHINYTALGANILFHPLLMAAIILTTRVPKQDNTEKIIQGIKKIVYGEELPPLVIKFKKSAQLGSATWLTINIFYLLMYTLTFGILIAILKRFGFNILSGFMFVLFLTLISFFGIRLRLAARELNVLKKKENIISFLFDLVSLPIIRAGRFISLNSKRINVFIFILDFIIETPYKFLVNSFEEITSFIKEKKEDID